MNQKVEMFERGIGIAEKSLETRRDCQGDDAFMYHPIYISS